MKSDGRSARLPDVLIVGAIVASAVAYRGWFRVFAIGSIPVVLGFALLSTLQIQGIDQNMTPWAGAFERVSAYGYFVWLSVFAAMAVRKLAAPHAYGAAGALAGRTRKPLEAHAPR